MKINYTSRKRKTKWFFSTVSLLLFLHSSFAQNNAIFKGGNADGFSISCVGTVGAEVPLPVGLISFSGKCVNYSVLLKWTTVSETNNDYFTIEQSEDAINFIEKGKVKGAGNSTHAINYSFIDEVSIKDIIYYKLKQTDFDGNYTDSKIVEVAKCKNNGSNMIVFPNPTQGNINLVINGDEETVYSIEIYNTIGEQIYNSSSLNTTIDLSENKNGIYFIHLHLASQTVVEKIILLK